MQGLWEASPKWNQSGNEIGPLNSKFTHYTQSLAQASKQDGKSPFRYTQK